MKNLTLIVHADTEQALADFLRDLPQVSDFTFTQLEEHGPQDEGNSELSARDLVVGYTPHVRVDLLLREKDVDAVLDALRGSHLGIAGRSRYWVTSVDAGVL